MMNVLALLSRYSRKAVLAAIVAGVVSGAANTGLLALINSALRRPGQAGSDLVLAFVALCLVVPLARMASELLLIHLGQRVIYEMRIDLSRQMLAVPLRHLEKEGPARLLAVLTGDIPTITGMVGQLPVLCISAAVSLGCLIYLGWLSWQVLLLVLVFLAIGILTYQLPILRATAYLDQARQERDDLYGHFRSLTEGTKELKLHYRRRDSFLNRVLRGSAERFRQKQTAGFGIFTVASSWGQLLVFVVLGLLLFAVPKFVPSAADAKTLTGYCLILLYLFTPLQTLLNTLPNLSQAALSIRRVEQMGLSLRNNAVDVAAEAPVEGASWTALELVGATHVYKREGEDRDFELGPIDLELRPGELVFIAGGNGSGKTTLAKVLVGLYLPERGEIRFNGEPVTDRNREAFRQHFSVVFSDFYLFEKLLGLEATELDERAERYLQELRLAHKVSVKDGALSTTDLSQGQRKRLALLTAYLEDRPIYLFDEWAADQDPIFKDVFYLQILPELKRRGKTVVVITHDDRYYRLADRLVKLDSGRIVDERELSPLVAVGATAPGSPVEA